MLANLLRRTSGFLFADPVRLIELFSALNLLSWAQLLARQPELLMRDSYSGFSHFGALTWAALVALIAGAQIIPVLFRLRHGQTMRFLAMCCAAGVWLVIALSFMSAEVSTTATANYQLLSLICMASGVYLGWNSSRNS